MQLNNLPIQNTVIYIVTGLIIIAAGYFIYDYLKKRPNGQKELQKFLDDIHDLLKSNIIEAINNYDFKDTSMETLADAQVNLLLSIYDDAWKLCKDRLDTIAGEDSMVYSLLKKIVTRDKIEDYVYTLFSSDEIQDKFIDIINIALKDENEKIEEEEKRLVQEASEMLIEDIDTYDEDNDTESSVPKLDPTKLSEVEEEIIPQHDEEEESVDLNDGSVEILEEDQLENISDKLDE